MKTLMRYEKYFFLLLVALHLIPVVFIEFFITHDGPSHVYNSQLITRLLQGDALTSAYFQFNPDPVPNWLGHALLAFFNLFAAGNVSERLLLGIYIFALPFSFRALLLVINKESRWASYMIFPFIYSLLFYLGFYNFCLGIPLLFFALTFFVRNAQSLTPKKVPLLMLLGLLMYSSHIFIVVLFSVAAALYLFAILIFNRPDKNGEYAWRKFFSSTALLFAALLPSLLLLSLFLGRTENSGGFSPLPLSDYMKFLFILRPLITLSFDAEQYFSIVVSVAFWLLLAYVLWVKVSKRNWSVSEVWLMLAVLILAAYFFVPDQLASGQFVTMRLLLFFFLFSLVWIGINPVLRAFRFFSVFIFISVSLWFLQYHYRESKKLSDETAEYISCLEKIQESSIVLPLNYTANWILPNASGYAGALKKIILLDNYEAETIHFPVQWKPGMNVYAEKNMTAIHVPFAQFWEYELRTGKKIDYVIRWNYDSAFADSTAKSADAAIREKYICIFTSTSKRAEVFSRIK